VFQGTAHPADLSKAKPSDGGCIMWGTLIMSTVAAVVGSFATWPVGDRRHCHVRKRCAWLNKALAMGLTAASSVALAGPASPHTHVDPDGSTVSWYPTECCNNRDCRPVVSIKPAPNGFWMTTGDGLTVLIGPSDSRRPSLDARWHICSGPGEMDDAGPQIFCVFEPPNS
jgi:hypothetical protein